MTSMASRVQLLKSVIQNMFVYTIMIHMRPKSVLHRLQMAINKFLWSGDLQKDAQSLCSGRNRVNLYVRRVLVCIF